MDPQMSLAICQAYNNWIHEFCSYSPDQLKWVAMLPVHDVHLACRELVRCVRELGAAGSFIRPKSGQCHYWHSNYWDRSIRARRARRHLGASTKASARSTRA
jgi:predicted TIM-barrel fold metal-dependent hydrolase